MHENTAGVPRGDWELALFGIAHVLGVPVADVEALLDLAASSARVDVSRVDFADTSTEVASSSFRLDEGELAGRWAICRCEPAREVDYEPDVQGSVLLRPSGRPGPALYLSFEPYPLPGQFDRAPEIEWSSVCFVDELYDTRPGESDDDWEARVSAEISAASTALVDWL